MQFLGEEHDTELKPAPGGLLWIPLTNCAGRAKSHTPFVDVMVKACDASLESLNTPTAVQFPGEKHDTASKNASGGLLWIPLTNWAGRAVSHSPFVDVMVNASRPLVLFLNCPTAVQFPGDEHDTEEVYISCGVLRRILSENTAGSAWPHPLTVLVTVALA